MLRKLHIPQKLFAFFLASVVLVFFYLRPLKSPWHPFIAGDGLGYYAYLPAKFIYHDQHLDFKWFNKVYETNYVNKSFDNPEDNFLVRYGDKKINKYYQGLSFIWMPFFLVAHLLAKLFHWPADGFSTPYQLAMCLASLFYLLLALAFLQKLLRLLVANDFAASMATILLFYGTPLFAYAIFSNTLSHVYSLCFNVMFLYYFLSACKHPEKFMSFALAAVLCYVITVGIRPLNALVLALTPLLFEKSPEKKMWRPGLASILLILVLVGFVMYQLQLIYTQTHTFFPYTYAGEHFNFLNGQFFAVLFSYRIGLFVYVPLILLSFIALNYLPQKKWWGFFLFFMGMAFIYSAWWYWPINRRALIDYYFIPALFMAVVLSKGVGRVQVRVYLVFLLIGVLYYQLKNYQMQQGILDEYKTYGEIYWRNFFRLKKANMYLIAPEQIMASKCKLFGFEAAESTTEEKALKKFIQREHVRDGKYALCLSPENNFCAAGSVQYPLMFHAQASKTVRFSCHMRAEEGVKSVHAFIQFFNRDGKSVLDVPFYLHEDDMASDAWDLKEFGYAIEDADSLETKHVQRIGVALWNNEAKGKVYVDNLRIDCLLVKPEN